MRYRYRLTSVLSNTGIMLISRHQLYNIVRQTQQSFLASHSAAALPANSAAQKKTVKLPVNDYGVPLLPENIRKKLFSKVRKQPTPSSVVKSARRELTKFGLSCEDRPVFKIPDISLPDIANNNISDHISDVARRQVRPYTDLLLELLSSPSPPRPETWTLQPGWTRYTADGGAVGVETPLERCLVLDVEVAVTEDPRAVMATAVSDRAWYSWLSPHLLHSQPFPESPVVRERELNIIVGIHFIF